MKIIAFTIGAAGLAAIVSAGCGSQGSRPAAVPTVTVTGPGPTMTQTVTGPGPTMTQTVTGPGPTVTQTSSVPAPSQPSGGAPAPSPGAHQVIVRLSGTGSQNTSTFTTPARWALSWAYWGCPGGRANFSVEEYNADGSPDLNGVFVNELGTKRGPVATYAYGDAGTHYLSVNTEGCSWSLVPVTG